MNFSESGVLGRRADLRDVDLDRLGRDGVGEVNRKTSLCVVGKLTESDSASIVESDVSSQDLISSVGSILL